MKMKSKVLCTKTIVILLIFSIVMIPFGNLTVYGADSQHAFTGNGYKIEFVVESQWNGAFNGKIIITNTGSQNIENWTLGLESENNITNIWNAQITSHENTNYQIQNAGWNKTIKPGENVSFGFTANYSTSIDIPEAYTLTGVQENEQPDNSIFTGENFSAQYRIDSKWDGAYNGSIILTNTGNETIDNWMISFESENNIVNIWNAKIYSHEDNLYKIKNDTWNQDIKPGQSVSFGFTAQYDTQAEIPDEYTMLGIKTLVTEDNYTIESIINSQWENGYTMDIVIKNLSERTLEDWELSFNMDTEIEQIWNGVITSHEEDSYTVKNAEYNANISPGSSINIGMKVTTSDNRYVYPGSCILKEITEGETGPSVSIDKSQYTYNRELENYCIFEEDANSIRGTLNADISSVNTFTYTVTDDQDITVKSGTISASKNWKVENIGYMMGINQVKVKAVLQDGTSLEDSLKVVCFNGNTVDMLDIDTQDNDNDGLINYLEDYYGTDKNSYDTDGDLLNDFLELAILTTNPLLIDSDGNGISDTDEDYDKDNLSNGNEVTAGTDPASDDSDYDNIKDNKELDTYHTDPLKEDTDGDGASDGWEIENGFNPLERNDSFNVDEALTADSGITVSVSTDLPGELADTVSITSVENNELLTEDIPGYIGEAFDFTAGDDINAATISFEFDPQLLSDSTFHPVIYYYNEETQLLEELETSVEGSTASAEVTHFSTYILLNKTEFDTVWEQDIKAPGTPDTEAKDLNIAFVVDVSGSMAGSKINTTKTVFNEFIDNLGENDRASVVKFNSTASVVQDLTSDKIILKNQVNNLSASGGTAIYAGISSGLDILTADTSTNGYDIMIVLSDGIDGYGGDYTSLIQNANGNDITIYSVGIGSDVDTSILTQVAENTGGNYYTANVADDLYEIFDIIRGETVDYTTDSNNDGISDYYTRLMCDGILVSGTGIKLFSGIPYDNVQANNDYDNDGLINGDEVEVTTRSDGKVYMKVNASPVDDDTDDDGYVDGIDDNPMDWDVGDRDLAMFAALAYEDGENYVNKMYTESDILGDENADSDKNRGQSYYFLDYAETNEISNKWKIVDFTDKWTDLDTYFSATTFKNKDNIVIAYRGTNEKIGEWVNNIFGVGILNYHSEEGQARAYAKKIADRYPGCKIYITGHSLGGYLTQIGTAELLENRPNVNIQQVSYFNGIGLKYNKILFWTKNKEMNLLKDFSNNGKNDKLISYNINGDVVSALGVHSGEEIGFDAAPDARENHREKHGTSSLNDFISLNISGLLTLISSININYYYYYYDVKSIMEYFWITHETDSFFYYLNQGTRNNNI